MKNWGITEVICLSKWGSRDASFRKSGVVELFSAMQIGGVEANKLHKAGFSELVKSQTANFDINALFICLFFAYFNCKAYK